MIAAAEGSSPTGLPAPAPGAIQARLFVVGCARSGTTLRQPFLAAHPAVLSFPETAVFGRLLASSESRFEQLFDAGQKAYIESRLEPIDF